MGVKVRFKKGAWWLVIDYKGRRRSKKIGDRDVANATAKKLRARLATGDLRCTEPDASQTPSATSVVDVGHVLLDSTATLSAVDAAAPVETPTLVNSYATDWLATIKGNLKASTVDFYRDNLKRYILPALGARPIGGLTRRDCKALITASRGRGLKGNSVKGIVRTLSAMLSEAVEDEKLAANPALRLGKYLRRGDEELVEIQPFNAGQAALLLTTAEQRFGR